MRPGVVRVSWRRRRSKRTTCALLELPLMAGRLVFPGETLIADPTVIARRENGPTSTDAPLGLANNCGRSACYGSGHGSDALVAARHRVSDLSALVHGLERRRNRRPAGHRLAARPRALARRRRDLALADLPVADEGLRLRRLRLYRRGPRVRNARGLRPPGRGRARAQPQGDPRLRAEPQLG